MEYEPLIYSLSFLTTTLGAFVLFSIWRQWRWGANAGGLFSGPADGSTDVAALQRQINATRSAALSKLHDDEDEEDDIDEEEPLAEGAVSRTFWFSPVYDEPQEDECQ